MSCQKCLKKPALTKCLRGALCKDCGQKCHPHFNHPLEFIVHAPPEQRINTLKTTKSMSQLAGRNNPPSRMSRVQSSIKTKRNERNAQICSAFKPRTSSQYQPKGQEGK